MEPDSGKRQVLEDINITGFFNRHQSHLPVSFRLHAEIIESETEVLLQMDHPGIEDGEVKVDADFNTIKVRFSFGKDDEDFFTNTYITPSPIDSDSLNVEINGSALKVTALKIRESE